jgi:UDP-N-acetylmuramate--alanine ligase
MKIYCSGIGGIGLSAFAALQNEQGHTVLGSDRAESSLLEDLRNQGIAVTLNQDGSQLPEDLDLFVYSEAIPEDAPERVQAEKMGVEQMSYFQALGMVSKTHHVIAVCGTHGKSSTVAMASRVLIDAGLDPTVVVGTKLPELGGRNWRSGKSEYFLLEACEYRRSFHYLSPDTVLMTNVDGDHFDAFDSVKEYQQAFCEFLDLLPQEGTVITHLSDPDCRHVTEGIQKTVVDVDHLAMVQLKTPGRHMQENAQLALGLAEVLGIDHKQAVKSLSSHEGCWRRMEVKGEYGKGVTVIDDYGHHPREIRAVLSALKDAYAGRRLVCVFQPHTHDRPLKLYDDFITAFADADVVVVSDVYEARTDIETKMVDMKKFIADIAKQSSVACVAGGALEASEHLLKEQILQPGDVVLTLGAGTITQLSDELVA